MQTTTTQTPHPVAGRHVLTICMLTLCAASLYLCYRAITVVERAVTVMENVCDTPQKLGAPLRWIRHSKLETNHVEETSDFFGGV